MSDERRGFIVGQCTHKVDSIMSIKGDQWRASHYREQEHGWRLRMDIVQD